MGMKSTTCWFHFLWNMCRGVGFVDHSMVLHWTFWGSFCAVFHKGRKVYSFQQYARILFPPLFFFQHLLSLLIFITLKTSWSILIRNLSHKSADLKNRILISPPMNHVTIKEISSLGPVILLKARMTIFSHRCPGKGKGASACSLFSRCQALS